MKKSDAINLNVNHYNMDVEQAKKIFFDNHLVLNYIAKADLVKLGIPDNKIQDFENYLFSQISDEIDQLFSNAVNDFTRIQDEDDDDD